MASHTSVCFICDLRHETKSSTHWCPECEEALCSDCMEHHSLSKGTRRHKIIPISQYQSLSNFVRDLQQLCIYHNEKYKQYCMKHECLICYKCIKEHGKCNAVVPLEDVVSGVKTSKLLQDLETSLIDILKNIKRIREDREINIKSIQNEEIQITLEIDSIKQQINQHLDTLKDDIMKELAKISHYHNDVIQTSVSSLKDQEKEITNFCMEIKNIKRYASDLQTFIGMRVVQSRVTENDRRLQSLIKNKSLENVIMQLTIDDKIKNILTFVNTFGKILIKKTSSDKTNWQSNKNKQALVSIPNKIQSINNISIALEQKIDTSSKWARGCTITRKGGFLFTDYFNSNEKLIKLNAQCNTEYIIQLSSPYSAFDVEFINDNTVAVTTGKSVGIGKRRGISIVDLTKRKVIKFIDLLNHTYGITFDGISLICCVEDRDLHLISSIDYSITTVPNTVLPWFSYVSTYACKIFYTNPNKHTVSCCLYNGTPVWEFKDENILKTPCGITVDDKGNFFVVGRDSCNVLVISSNGKYTKQILNKEDGLRVPTAIFLDNIGKQLLVTSDQKVAYLYRISID